MAGADDVEPVRKVRERLDDEIRPLVAHEPADVEEVAAPLSSRREVLGVHRWVDHLGGASVVAADPLGDRRRVGDELGDAGRRAAVPSAKRPHPLPGERPDREREALLLALEVPGVAHRRVAVAEVRHARGNPNGLRTRVAARDHEVGVGRGHRLPSERHQRQEPLVMPRRAGNPLQERCARVGQEWDRSAVEQGRQDRGAGKGASHRLDDSLRAPSLDDPLLSDGHAHRATIACPRREPEDEYHPWRL